MSTNASAVQPSEPTIVSNLEEAAFILEEDPTAQIVIDPGHIDRLLSMTLD